MKPVYAFAKAIVIFGIAVLAAADAMGQGEVINPVFPYWKTKGNTGTDTATYFVGTKDNNYLTFRTNNIRRATIDLNGNLGIGTVYPAEKLHLYGTGSSGRFEGVGTGGTYLGVTAVSTDKLLWADANGTIKGLTNGTGGDVLTISSTTSSPAWTSANGLFWKLTGNSGTNDPAVPVTYGTSAIGAAENWIGTTDANDVVFGTNNIERMRIKQTNGMLGIGNAVPASLVDINGDLALREGTALALANGSNALTLVGEFSHYRLTGPTTAFAVNTIANGNNGQLLTLINGTTQVMTINNNNAANGILTGTGANLVSVIGTNNSVTLIYNASLARWVVIAYTGMVSGNDWHITGNTGINNPAVPATYGTSTIAAAENWMGTTDANDVVFGTNNIERMRVMKTTGLVGIGTAVPANRLTVQPSAFTTPATSTTYAFGINNSGGTQDYTFGSSASFVYEQSWNAKPLLINNQGNFVGINLGTAPIQNLDINGRVNVTNGVIQRGTTQINATSDLGLYSQVSGNWIRIAANAAPIKFFTDQGGANSAGTNALVAMDNTNGGGVMIAAETGGTGNAGAPYVRAALEVSSTTKGMLTPRLTTTQRDAMGTNLTEGLLIYNTDNDCFEWWDTKSTPGAGNGFWNSLCEWCEQVVIVSASQTGFNLNTYIGGATARRYCVYVNAGVTLTPSGNGGGSGVAGNPGFNATTMPAGASVVLYNYGTIYGGGGNGGQGGREGDGVCQGDNDGQAGGAGGSCITTNSSVPIKVFNYGTLRAGGGGGGGGRGGCCSSGGGGGGGAGTPAGAAGASNSWSCVGGFVCPCGGRSGISASGTAGAALTAGVGGGNSCSGGTGCPLTSSGCGSPGGAGGVPAVAGSAGSTANGCCGGGCNAGAGGAAGLAVQGNGSGSSLSNVSGTVTGGVNP